MDDQQDLSEDQPGRSVLQHAEYNKNKSCEAHKVDLGVQLDLAVPVVGHHEIVQSVVVVTLAKVVRQLVAFKVQKVTNLSRWLRIPHE